MRKLVIILMFCFLPVGWLMADGEIQMNIEEGKGIIKAFFGDLKGQLTSAMKQGGPVHAMSVCNLTAPSITERHSKTTGWQVSRTSLKTRNPDNAPDAWELMTLNEFETRKQAGEDPMKIAKAVVVEEGGAKTFRMMKAIPTAEVCLKCHGAELDSAVAAKLDELYPADQARGYSAGDLRGAFSLQKAL